MTLRGQILVSRTDDDPLLPVCGVKTSPCVHSNVPVCTGTTRTCFNTRARGAGIHGGVFESTYGFFHVFSACRNTHTKHTPRPQRHTPHNTTHNITRRQTERDRERQRKKTGKEDRARRQRKRDREGDTRPDKTREEKRYKTRTQEKMKEERRDKRREKEREERREKRLD